MDYVSRFACVLCDKNFAITDDRTFCDCGGLLDVIHDLARLPVPTRDPAYFKSLWRQRSWWPKCAADKSGVWRFRELVMPDLDPEAVVTRGEGNTRLYAFPKTSAWLGLPNALFKHEGENPTGSFKDRGMTVAMSWAKTHGAKIVACASTGNTSASVASYASLAGLPAVILISEKGTALGKISQSLAYGARTVKVRGDFDAALALVMAARAKFGLTILNSVNAIRLEGQKTIIWEALEQLDWQAPDWIVVPGGNLGNASAFGKALTEAKSLGLIDRMPRLAIVQAAGANPLYRAQFQGWTKSPVKAETIATAIKIGDPVNFDKAVRALRDTNGVVTEVGEAQIMEAKAVIDSDGVGAEPASCVTAAGIKRLMAEGVIAPDGRVVSVLTGHMLKDPDATIGYHGRSLQGIASDRANEPVTIDATLEALEIVLSSLT